MRDPDPKNPNSVPPPRGSDDVIKPKRVGNGGSVEGKLAPKYTFSISKPTVGSGRKNIKKGYKGRVLKRIMEGMEYDDAVGDVSDVRDGDKGIGDDVSVGMGGNCDVGRSVKKGVEDNRGPSVEEGLGDDGLFSATDTIEVCEIFQGSVAKNVEKLEKLANKNNTVGDIPVPFAENAILNPGFKGMAASGSNKLSRIPVRVNEKGNNVVDMDPLLEEGSKKWDLTLVGYFVGLKMSYAEISGHLRRMWRTHQLAEIITNDCGLYFIKFRLASSLGNPIIMDRITASMCEKAYGRASFARVLVEVDASKELAESIEVCYSSLGKSMNLRVEYAWKPPLCTHCKVFGHDFCTCKVRERTHEEKRSMEDDRKKIVACNMEENVKVNGGWQEVRRPVKNVASTSKNLGQQNDNRNIFGNRGGYNGRGRDGMFGRGGLSGGRGGMYQRENYEGVGKKFIPVRNVGHWVDKVHVMEGESSGSRVDKRIDGSFDKSGSVKKTIVKEGFNVRNSFEALVDETVEIGGEEWVQIKSKIDLACELGMQIDDNEKKRWSEDLSTYYVDKCEANIKKNMIAGLKWRIAKLQQDIVHINTYVSSVANDGAEKQCAGVMKKEGITRNQAYGKICDEIYKIRENWTDETIQQYEGLIGEKRKPLELLNSLRDEVSYVVEGNDGEMQETQLRKKIVNKICNEVFGDRVWVSNSVKSKKGCRIAVGWDPAIVTPVLLSQTSQIMHFLVKSNFDNNDIYVSFVYGEINAVGRRELWDNIRDHNNVAGVNDFRACVETVNIEDVKVMGLFFTWVQKRRDPNSVFPELKGRKNKAFRFLNYLTDKEFIDTVRDNWNIRVKGYDMFILAKRLQSLKKHMRDLNKKNGDVCEKVRKLKVELDRVQEALSRDPSIVYLREEELVYSESYRRAVTDEELLMKQKVIKSRIESVYDEYGNVFYNDDMGAKFIDPDSAVKLVKRISDKEIKMALFDIDDNKASGPNGYTSKFFKSAWSVVGKDRCAAIKEFFTSGKLLGELNTSIISLIPKVVVPKKVINYRPISCCNVVYKTISKVITNRLKRVLNGLVGENQSAFIPGRQISDNILLTQEFMRGYHWNVWHGSSRCAFKINIQYAYDTVNWKFLESILKCFGFHPIIINWIMICLTTASFSVCINDLISASVLRRGLDEFCLSSGLLPSLAKSEAFYGNVSNSVKYDISLVMPFKEGVLPVKYLGVPMVSKMITHRDCMVVIEVIRKRVGDWGNKSLSFAGMLQLISSILSSLQVYWSSLFLLPINTCNQIDRLLKNFLWMGGGSNKGIISVSWKDICKPKSQGGLGLRFAHLWNEALLAKHIWNVVSGKESLWVKWVNIYRLKGRSMWDVELYKGQSWCWKILLDLRDKVKRFIQVKIRNGKTCNVWFDKWQPNDPLGRLINHRVLEQAGMCLKNKVGVMIEGNEWVWPIEWDDRFEEVINISVPILEHDVNDKTVWVDKNGKEKLFSVKEVWKAVRIDCLKVIWMLLTMEGWLMEDNDSVKDAEDQ
uniref:Reverse transcriptase domain-containing protein n=1 Tax=Tanacetum cinerariifolium TaxID=118510 RepID=A0A699GMM1_TANCI|nr:hypothetical protein [Tanacetum cinerariifolium]